MALTVFLSSLFGLMLLGMPIAFALMLTGVALMVHLDFFDAQLVAQNMLSGADNYPLMAVPFFILAGELMNAGGISQRIINLAVSLVEAVKEAPKVAERVKEDITILRELRALKKKAPKHEATLDAAAEE